MRIEPACALLLKEAVDPEPHTPWPTGSLLFVAGVLVAASTGIVLATAPFAELLGPGANAIGAACHGLSAFLLMVTSTIGLYLAWRLVMGRLRAFPDLQLLNTVSATLSLITVVSGNWIYIAYRAKTPEAPRAYFLSTAPEVHQVFFEFKEYAALFTLPISVAAAFLAWSYGREVVERAWLRTTLAALMALHFFYFVVAFGLGAAVTKLKGI